MLEADQLEPILEPVVIRGYSQATSTLVSSAMAIAERLSALVHRFLQLSALPLGKPDLFEPAQQFLAGDTDFAAHHGNTFAVPVDFDHLAPVDDIVQDALAVVGHLGCSSYHIPKIPIFGWRSSTLPPPSSRQAVRLEVGILNRARKASNSSCAPI